MTIFNSQKPLESTPFSDFFRKAPSREKNKVYDGVLKRATERQQRVIERSKDKK